MKGQNGKGDTYRPLGVTPEVWAANWERAFGKTPQVNIAATCPIPERECRLCGYPSVGRCPQCGHDNSPPQVNIAVPCPVCSDVLIMEAISDAEGTRGIIPCPNCRKPWRHRR